MRTSRMSREHPANGYTVSSSVESSAGSDEADAAYYERLEADFDEQELTQREYSDKSEDLLHYVEFLWTEKKDCVLTLQHIRVNICFNFFHWVLRTRTGRIKCASTLQTYWNVFCLMREQHTKGAKIDLLLKRQMVGVRQRLVRIFGLDTEKKPKPIVRAEDEFELLKTLWTFPEVTFNHERQRVQLALFCQLAGITGSRPAALLALCYKDVKVTLLRDPAGGEQPRPLIEISFARTKGYLGSKDTHTFGIPAVPSEPCLLLCPQVNLLAIAFADQAFATPILSKPEQFFQLRVREGNEMVLPWKDAMHDVPLFRGLERNLGGYTVSSQPATDSWVRNRMAKLGAVTGFEPPVGPYCFRRGNGEALDSSSQISDAQRNLVLQHHDSRVYLDRYASKYMPNTDSAFRRVEEQPELMRFSSGISRTIDPRRPRELNGCQLAKVKQHPEVKLMRRVRERLHQEIRAQYGARSRAKGTPLYKLFDDADKRLRSKERALYRTMLKQVRTRFKKEQAVADISAQLGASFIKTEPQRADLAPAPRLSRWRRRAINALFTFATDSHAEECRRRIEAIGALIGLIMRQEPHSPPKTRRAACSKPVETALCREMADVPKSPVESAVPMFPIECQPTQCVFCLGETALPMERRVREFCTKGDLKKHLFRKHLQNHPDDTPITCPHPECDEVLQHTQHLRRHAEDVPKTPT